MPDPDLHHDIFISYASEDREKAQQLAAALAKQGWSVWWDRTIPAGKDFAAVIDEALAASRCVVAMWSGVSVGKNWVLEEAQDGLDRKILVPVLIEAVDPPRGFRRIQAADLNEWDGSDSAPQFKQLVGDIAHILGPPPGTEREGQFNEAVRPEPEVAKAPPDEVDERPEPAGAPDGQTPSTEKKSKPRWLSGDRLTKVFVGIVFVAMMGGFWAKDRYFDRAVVPNLRGLTETEARRVLDEADIPYQIETDFNANIESGTVLYQIPAADTPIQRDEDVVDLVVAQSVTVPDLIGARLDRAEVLAKAAQLELEQIGTDIDPAVPEGVVLTQSPEAGARVEPGSLVEVVVSEETQSKIDKERVRLEAETKVPLPDMAVIPAGSFQRDGTTVAVTQFAIGRYEVTFDQYDAFARVTGRELPDDEGWGRDDRPAINVSWNDASAYAEWLSEQTGRKYRLPTEVEWEYAARAGTDTDFWWGNDVGENGQVWANCDGCGSEWDNQRSAPVGTFPANGFGLHDTAGNVREWVQNCWEDSCNRRVVRGGSWFNGPRGVRSASRSWIYPDTRSLYLGFRLAQDL